MSAQSDTMAVPKYGLVVVVAIISALIGYSVDQTLEALHSADKDQKHEILANREIAHRAETHIELLDWRIQQLEKGR